MNNLVAKIQEHLAGTKLTESSGHDPAIVAAIRQAFEDPIVSGDGGTFDRISSYLFDAVSPIYTGVANSLPDDTDQYDIRQAIVEMVLDELKARIAP